MERNTQNIHIFLYLKSDFCYNFDYFHLLIISEDGLASVLHRHEKKVFLYPVVFSPCWHFFTWSSPTNTVILVWTILFEHKNYAISLDHVYHQQYLQFPNFNRLVKRSCSQTFMWRWQSYHDRIRKLDMSDRMRVCINNFSHIHSRSIPNLNTFVMTTMGSLLAKWASNCLSLSSPHEQKWFIIFSLFFHQLMRYLEDSWRLKKPFGSNHHYSWLVQLWTFPRLPQK